MGKGTLMQLGAGVAQGGFSMLGASRQHRRNKRLMNHQMGNQMALNKQGNKLAYDLWNKTNVGAQMEHLKKAGLNPSLIYGKQGAEGTTTGTGGGSASGSGAGMEQMNQMDLANAELVEAKAENLRASASKNRAETETENLMRDKRIRKLHEEINSELAKQEVDWKKAGLLNEQAIEQNYNNEAVFANKDTFMQSKWADMNRKIVELESKKLGLKLTKEQIKEVEHKIWQGWVNAGSGVLASSGFVLKALKGFGHNPKETFTQYKDGTTKTTTY